LLVDEVDVFFSKEFYGETYNPVLPLRLDEVTALQQAAWKMRQQSLNSTLQAIQGMGEYSTLVHQYAGVKKLIDGQIMKMLRDLEEWKSGTSTTSHPYKMQDGKVAYKNGVCYDDQISLGYLTLWTYLHEQGLSPGSVDEAAVEAQFGLSIECGQFSYAEIPKGYDLILGVTGTLVPEAPGKQHPLGSFERSIVRDDFKIKGQTELPSVYGEQRLTFREAEHVSVHPDETAWYIQIGMQIEKARGGRAVLIYFESEAKLREFQESEYGRQGAMQTITSATRDVASRVRKATHTGSVTLLSREQGRGLDFHCSDKVVEETGGLHVVQTFLSEELSEEIQIKGRTARQKNKGSFELILLAPDLDKFEITEGELAEKGKGSYVPAVAVAEGAKTNPAAVAAAATAAAMSAEGAAAGGSVDAVPSQTMYEFLHLRRAVYLEKHVTGRKEAVACANRMHRQTLVFQRDLVTLAGGHPGSATPEWQRCLRFLSEHNIQKAKCRLMILTDATGSMAHTWKSTQEGICNMLGRVEDVSGGGGNMEVKFVAYRDYELERERVLEASSWTSDPASLVRFVKDIKCRSETGCDPPEAVEAALNLVNREADPPTQVLLIGDMPPHFERKGQAIKALRVHASNKAAGELVQGGLLQTDYRRECAVLAKKGIKVSALCVESPWGTRPTEEFGEIAKITGGESKGFDADDTEALVHAVCEAGLADIGGEEMVAKYRMQYRS
jgi:hypothetical protein